MLHSSVLFRFLPTRWGVATALVVLAVAGALKWNAGLMPENVSIPVPPPPVPNARDYYTQAEALRGYRELEQAVYQKSASNKSDWYDVPPRSRLPIMRKLVAADAAAFAKLREGLRYQYQAPPARTFATIMPYYAQDRDMARLLRIKSQMLAQEGDWNGAINADIDTIRFGVSLQRGEPPMIGGLVGIACEEIGRKDAWGVVDHLSASEARAAAARMEAAARETVPWADVLQGEKLYSQASLLSLFHEHDWRKAFLPSDDPSDPSSAPVSFTTLMAVSLESPREAYRSYTLAVDEQIRRSRLVWPTQHALKQQPLPTDPIGGTFVILSESSEYKQAYVGALNNMLLVELALRAYRLERGAYPASLKQLVPAYLPSVPADPFSDGQPLQYRQENGHSLLYSIGPDAVDDGGQPPVWPKSPSGTNMRHVMSEDDKGDLLAGAG